MFHDEDRRKPEAGGIKKGKKVSLSEDKTYGGLVGSVIVASVIRRPPRELRKQLAAELHRRSRFSQAIMGYLIVLILGVVLVGVLIVALSKQGAGSMKGKLPEKEKGATPVGYNSPAADEPTPGASRTSSPAQAQSAQKHTPPA